MGTGPQEVCGSLEANRGRPTRPTSYEEILEGMKFYENKRMKGVYMTDMTVVFKYLTGTIKKNGNLSSISTVH